MTKKVPLVTGKFNHVQFVYQKSCVKKDFQNVFAEVTEDVTRVVGAGCHLPWSKIQGNTLGPLEALKTNSWNPKNWWFGSIFLLFPCFWVLFFRCKKTVSEIGGGGPDNTGFKPVDNEDEILGAPTKIVIQGLGFGAPRLLVMCEKGHCAPRLNSFVSWLMAFPPSQSPTVTRFNLWVCVN